MAAEGSRTRAELPVGAAEGPVEPVQLLRVKRARDEEPVETIVVSKRPRRTVEEMMEQLGVSPEKRGRGEGDERVVFRRMPDLGGVDLTAEAEYGRVYARVQEARRHREVQRHEMVPGGFGADARAVEIRRRNAERLARARAEHVVTKRQTALGVTVVHVDRVAPSAAVAGAPAPPPRPPGHGVPQHLLDMVDDVLRADRAKRAREDGDYVYDVYVREEAAAGAPGAAERDKPAVDDIGDVMDLTGVVNLDLDDPNDVFLYEDPADSDRDSDDSQRSQDYPEDGGDDDVDEENDDPDVADVRRMVGHGRDDDDDDDDLGVIGGGGGRYGAGSGDEEDENDRRMRFGPPLRSLRPDRGDPRQVAFDPDLDLEDDADKGDHREARFFGTRHRDGRLRLRGDSDFSEDDNSGRGKSNDEDDDEEDDEEDDEADM